MMHLSIAVVFALKILCVHSRAQELLGVDPVPSTKCVCTPYYKCYDEETSSVLQGVVGDRNRNPRIAFRGDRPIIKARQNGESVCPNDIDKCCFNLDPSSGMTSTIKPSLNPQTSNSSQKSPEIPGVSPTASSGDRFSGPYENVWSSLQCEYIVWYNGKSLSQCKSMCLEWSTCTALNYKEGPYTECILWECPLPAPSPKSTRATYKGYSLIPGVDPAPSTKCVCTPFYKCYDGETSSVLQDVVDDRIEFKGDRPVITVRQNGESACPIALDRCCFNLDPSSGMTSTINPSLNPQTLNSSQKSPEIPGASPTASSEGELPVGVGILQPTNIHEECGVKNSEGVGFTMKGFTDGQAQYGELPWMVALLKSNTDVNTEEEGAKNLFLGGGSLIDPRVVLTAAHKIFDHHNTVFRVRIGEWNFGATNEPTPHQDIRVKNVISHPKFNRELRKYNYALLILERPVELGATVGTICLPSTSSQNFDGQQCIVSGWGKDIFGREGRFQRILKLVNVNKVEHSQCQLALKSTRLGSNFTLDQSFVCAGDQGKDACTGDGGSPLVCHDPLSPGQYVQVGISAWGIGCNEKGIPGVYSDVTLVVEWIQEHLDQLHAIVDESKLADD